MPPLALGCPEQKLRTVLRPRVIIWQHLCVQTHDPSGQSSFHEAIHHVLESIGPGEILSYGEVAEEAGFPRSARAVGQYLRNSSGYPWWRIVTAKGRLVPGNEARQAALLRSEGVTVSRGYIVDMRPKAR